MNDAHRAGGSEKMTDDALLFGKNVYVYCNQHLRPHLTGWCTVSIQNKTKLEATTEQDAYLECRSKGFVIYNDSKSTDTTD